MLNKKTYRALKQKVIINDSNEEMLEIPKEFLRFTPHPYKSLGAPYRDKSPFFLRNKVIELLHVAQKKLTTLKPNYRLKIFDAYRPLQVQSFMIEYDTQRLSQEMYKTPFEILLHVEQEKVQNIVKKFWSPISQNVALNPPPHSTGGALDLTIVDEKGIELNMGTIIDELREESESDFYSTCNESNIFQTNRNLLLHVMNSAGFTQLPTEWWHFSYGDQIWAVNNSTCEESLLNAKYGLV